MPHFLFGVGRTTITPPLGVELCGYGYYLERRATEIFQDLHCTALALSDGEAPYVWLSNDLIWVDRSLIDATLRVVQHERGLDPSRVVFTNTHTHSGPATMKTVGCGEWNDAYARTLPRLFADAIGQALDRMEPGRVGFGRATVHDLSVNRVESDGPVDREAMLIRVDDRHGRMRAAAINFSAHPVSLGASPVVCGDYPGDGLAKMERELGEAAAFLFFQGSCGNLNGLGFGKGMDALDHNGTLLKDQVLPALDRVATSPDATLAGDRVQMPLPMQVPVREALVQELNDSTRRVEDFSGDRQTKEYRQLRFERDWRQVRLELLDRPHPQRLEIEVSYLRINEAILVAHPLELFLEFGNAIKAASPYPHTFLVGYANEPVGYLARPQDFTKKGFGSYAAVIAPRLCRHLEFQPDAGEVFCNHILALLNRVRQNMDSPAP